MSAIKHSPAQALGVERALPSAFGRFTLILSQHRELGDIVRQLEAHCSAKLRDDRTDATYSLDTAELLARWRRDLCAHFATEESDAYFGLLASETPALISKIAELRAEHTTMLERLARLIEAASDPGPRARLFTQTQQLIRLYLEHERTESCLLQAYFEGG